MRFELTTPTLARLCSTPELRPLRVPPDSRWREAFYSEANGLVQEKKTTKITFLQATKTQEK